MSEMKNQETENQEMVYQGHQETENQENRPDDDVNGL